MYETLDRDTLIITFRPIIDPIIDDRFTKAFEGELLELETVPIYDEEDDVFKDLTIDGAKIQTVSVLNRVDQNLEPVLLKALLKITHDR